MREIKFRAWLPEKNDMMPIYEIDFWNRLINHDGNCGMKRKYILEQFTGLLDINGKEIYEGDICKNHQGLIGSITWDSIHARFGFSIMLTCTDQKRRPVAQPIATTSKLLIIGNIHDKEMKV